MHELNGNIEKAKKQIMEMSKKRPTKYFTLYACFGLFVQEANSIGVHTPSDSIGGVYWKAGKERQFTECQIIIDQVNTPTMY